MMLFWSGIVLSFFVVSASTSDDDPCVSYKELRNAKRSQFHSIAGLDRVQCDRDLILGWYRFKGRAGLKMPESCVKSGYCGTHSPGWFQGSHPTKVGDVTNGRVCFNFMGSCCEWYMSAKVKKCNGFYVYRLPPTLYCDLQYCGDGATDLDCATDNTDISVNGSTPSSLSSPNFPSQYPDSLQCIWRITAPAGMRVKLGLNNLTLGSNDYITFRDGIRDDSEEIAKYADCASGELRLFSTDRYILVNFVSDASEPGIGFQLDFESVMSDKIHFFPNDDICSPSTNATSLSGIIRSPGMPGSPSGNLKCSWSFNYPVGYKVLIEFSWFGLAKKGNQSHCTNDHVSFHTDSEAQTSIYCGCKLPPKRLYNSGELHVIFNNSRAANQAGFLFQYRAVAADECMNGVDSCEIKMGAVGMNKHGDLSYEPVEPTQTLPLLTTATTTTTKTATKPVEDFAMDVKCDKDEINVVLHISSALRHNPDSIHLNDASCKPYFHNDTHIYIKSTLEGCGMAWNMSEDGKMIIYRNAINVLVRSQSRLGSHATRDHQAVFEFQCSYRRKAMLSGVTFDPSKIHIVTDIQSFGNFTFEMHLFKSGHFKEYYTEYPVGPINVGTDIFLQVSATSSDSGLVVFVDECKATPSTEYNDQNQFMFLEDGCPKDNTLRYNYTLSSVQRLTLSAFRFNAVKSKEIFLHCLVKACLRSDQESRCAKGCIFGKRRKRESEQEIDRLLAVGPIIVSSNPQVEESLTPKESTRILIGIVAGLLGFIAVLLVAALVSVICNRRKKHKSGAATLLVVRKNEPCPG